MIERQVAHLWSMRGNSLWKTSYDQTRKVTNRQQSVNDHKVIFQALKRGQPEVAQTAMQPHLDVLAERFIELNFGPPPPDSGHSFGGTNLTDQPDIVMIVTDQQCYDTIHALEASHRDTPNLDRHAERRVTFSNCHVTGPSCVPSRASLFSGYYPHTNGVLANGQPWARTWVSDLHDAGYQTVDIGKMHTIPYNAPAGFDERYIVENKGRYMEGRYYFDEWDKAMAAQGLVKQQRVQYRALPDYKDRLGAFTWDLDP